MTLDPPALVLWLATGRRRLSLRVVRYAAGILAFLLTVGPGAFASPVAAAGDARLPGPLTGTSLHPVAVSAGMAERMLGAPSLDAPASAGRLQDLGLWGTAVQGPFGHTVVVFHVYNTPRLTWLTISQLRTERPIQETPWELFMAQPARIGPHSARLYEQPGSITVSWRLSPTLQASLSEDDQGPRGPRGAADPTMRRILDAGPFLQLAAAIRPHGLSIGPLRLDAPW